MITVTDDFLEPDFFFNVNVLSKQIYTSADCELKTNASWNNNVVLTSNTVLIHEIQDTDILKTLQQQFEEYIITPSFSIGLK